MRQSSSGGSQTAPLFLRLVTPMLRARSVSALRPAPKTTFVLSTGRTGTVYLADLLNQLDGVVALHEPKPSRVLNAWTTAFLEGRVAARFMTAALFAKRRKTLKNVRAELYVESNNFIAGFADALHDVFETPTVIHLVRDPRDFATSLTNRGDDIGLRGFFNRYIPCWAYVPDGLKKRQLTQLTRPAYRWVAINEYLSAYGKGRQNYHFFKFEEVFDKNDQTELKRLLRAIGLNAKQIAELDFEAKARSDQPKFSLLDRPSTSANASKYQAMPKWRDWSAEQKRTFDKICGPLMREYGYGDEPEWP